MRAHTYNITVKSKSPINCGKRGKHNLSPFCNVQSVKLYAKRYINAHARAHFTCLMATHTHLHTHIHIYICT